MTSAPRRLLVISYPFPPAAVVGVYRTVKYCKYLPDRGWIPIVLTVPFPGSPHRDDALADEIPPQVEVVRTTDPNVDTVLLRIRRWLDARRREAPAAAGVPGPAHVGPVTGAGLARRLAGWVSSFITECPDPQVFWVPFAVARGAWLLMRREVDAIYSTSPPHSSHIAAWCLARLTRKPYVLDFRDPWEIGGPIPWLMRRLKRLVVAGAARVVTISDGERTELLRELPGLDPDRVAVITNGYDPDDFARLNAPAPRNGKVTLSHVGMIHRGTGGEFFEALLRLSEHEPDEAAKLHVTLVGAFDSQYRAIVERLEARGIVSRAGLLPHRVALQALVDSDVLVILLGGDRFAPSELPAKLPEYLYAGRPILAVAKPGDLWDVLERSRAGVAIAPHDPRAVSAAIVRLSRAIRTDSGAFRPDRAYIERFDRRVLATRFAAVLDEAVSARGTSAAGA